jgi:hypothetical protein
MTSREYGIASSIDVVFREKDGRYPLADIKTTSAIHIQNVTLQLSIYAMMFEVCNPDKTAGELFVAWLPKAMYGTPRMIQVQRIPADECEVIINEYLAKGDAAKCRDIVAKYVQQPTFTEGVLPAEMADVEKEIVRIEQEQSAVSLRQYGPVWEQLPPSDYKRACHLPNGRSAFTFCVCPGGQVVAAASTPGQLVTNGMSLRARDGKNINGGFLVGKFTYPLAQIQSVYVSLENLNYVCFKISAGSTSSINFTYTSDKDEAYRIEAFWKELLGLK